MYLIYHRPLHGRLHDFHRLLCVLRNSGFCPSSVGYWCLIRWLGVYFTEFPHARSNHWTDRLASHHTKSYLLTELIFIRQCRRRRLCVRMDNMFQTTQPSRSPVIRCREPFLKLHISTAISSNQTALHRHILTNRSHQHQTYISHVFWLRAQWWRGWFEMVAMLSVGRSGRSGRVDVHSAESVMRLRVCVPGYT